MRQKLQTAIFFLILSTLTLSCKKETEDLLPDDEMELSNTNQDEIKVVNGRLTFKDKDFFEEYLSTNSSKNTRQGKFEGFISMNEYYENKSSYRTKGKITCDTLPFEDDYLANFLTPEGIIEIGDYVFKINMPDEKVYALHKEKVKENLQDLYEEKRNNAILEFSTNDEVLTLLEDRNSSAQEKLFCGETRANNDDDRATIDYGNGEYRMNCKVVYQTAGIYFSLIGRADGRVKSVFGWYVNHPITMTANYSANWKPRCGTARSVSDSRIETTSSLRIRVYESVRGLNNYSYNIVFTNHFAGWDTRLFSISG
ncbi:hypothetical protein RCC89_17780 [Cytophagaceae bacterium ABcell3]|nr:hypothetical protein RCC89_17780 [Cytophagaceae bacterium ABcell3]